MKNIVYTTPNNGTIEISWDQYREEIEKRAQKRLAKKQKQAANK